MTDKDKKKKRDYTPEQKLGDTPIAPWEMPTSEEKKQAKPVKRALKEAIKSVDSQKKADKVIDDLESATAEKKAEDVKQSQPAPASPADAAQKVKQAAESADGSKKAEKVLKETAKVLATAERSEEHTS